jgi:hypothetical protein
MEWYKIVMTESETATGKHTHLQEKFNSLYVTAIGPKGAVMVAKDDINTGDWVVFFSPKAVDIAKPLIDEYLAEPCDRPERKGLALLVGQQSTMDELFD